MTYVSNSNAQRPDSGITRGENRNNPPIAVHYTNVVPAGSPGLNIPSKSLSEEHTASTEKGFEPRSKSNSIEPEPTSSDELFEEILTPGFDDFEFELIPQGDPAL
ncbi:MAG: hypothetical protein LBF94_04455, partial [Puniceicoccales bacterium]|nr:hypothetical protein [Puniceicoccales bacterium]